MRDTAKPNERECCSSDVGCHVCGVCLGHRGVHGARLALICEPCGVMTEQARGRDMPVEIQKMHVDVAGSASQVGRM